MGLVVGLYAQVPNRTVTDCSNNSRDIHSVLASGNVLLVASKGFDCSICKSKASSLQSWAAQNKNAVEVWGAMTFTYSGNTPACSDVSAWVSAYGWNDIFSFIDASKYWYKSGTPRYIVYNPADSTIAYEGANDVLAQNTALGLATSIGDKEVAKREFSISAGSGFVTLSNLPHSTTRVQVISLIGQVMKTATISAPGDVEQVSLENYTPGIYLVNIQNKSGFQAVRKVYLR